MSRKDQTMYTFRSSKINEKYLPPKQECILFCKASACMQQKYMDTLNKTHLYGIESSDILKVLPCYKQQSFKFSCLQLFCRLYCTADWYY